MNGNWQKKTGKKCTSGVNVLVKIFVWGLNSKFVEKLHFV